MAGIVYGRHVQTQSSKTIIQLDVQSQRMHFQPGKTENQVVDPWILALKHWVWTRLVYNIWGLTVVR